MCDKVRKIVAMMHNYIEICELRNASMSHLRSEPRPVGLIPADTKSHFVGSGGGRVARGQGRLPQRAWFQRANGRAAPPVAYG
jgi:hypothetical protein